MHVVIKNVTNIMEFGLIGNWINMELIANTRWQSCDFASTILTYDLNLIDRYILLHVSYSMSAFVIKQNIRYYEFTDHIYSTCMHVVKLDIIYLRGQYNQLFLSCSIFHAQPVTAWKETSLCLQWAVYKM